MARYESFAPAELGRMFLMLHRSEKRLRVIEETDPKDEREKKLHKAMDVDMSKEEYELCNGMPHKDKNFRYNERRQVKYALRKLKEWAAGESKRPTAAQWKKFHEMIQTYSSEHDNLMDSDDENLSYIDGDASEKDDDSEEDEQEEENEEEVAPEEEQDEFVLPDDDDEDEDDAEEDGEEDAADEEDGEEEDGEEDAADEEDGEEEDGEEEDAAEEEEAEEKDGEEDGEEAVHEEDGEKAAEEDGDEATEEEDGEEEEDETGQATTSIFVAKSAAKKK